MRLLNRERSSVSIRSGLSVIGLGRMTRSAFACMKFYTLTGVDLHREVTHVTPSLTGLGGDCSAGDKWVDDVEHLTRHP
jgi:hypothetical protein